jgi:hypothetical protein
MGLVIQGLTKIVGDIEIRGGAEFCARTKEALELLMRRRSFAEVHGMIAVIREGKRSGMRASEARPTFVVGKPTWRHSALWYAGAIAHDAYHSKLYHEAKAGNDGKTPNRNTWTGAAAEKICLAFQRRVLEELGAGREIIAYVRECEENPGYQGSNKRLKGWLDYLRRRW